MGTAIRTYLIASLILFVSVVTLTKKNGVESTTHRYGNIVVMTKLRFTIKTLL